MAPFQKPQQQPEQRQSGPSNITPEALARLEAATNEVYEGDEDSVSGNSIGLSSACGDGDQSEYQSTRNGESRRSEEQASPKAISDQLSAKESQKVFRLRLAVSLVLIATGVAISGIVFKITTDGEVEEFTNHYENAAAKLVDTFQDILVRMGSVAGLGVSFTSQGMHAPGTSSHAGHASSWPFVTMDDFPPKARNALQLSGALMVGMSPVVQGNLFHAWNDYVVHPDQIEWINQSLAYQKHLPLLATHTDLATSAYAVNGSRSVDVMHYFDDWTVMEEVPGGPWYLPEWQTSPYVHHGMVNNNLLRNENTTEFVTTVIEDGTAVAGGFNIYPPGDMENPDEDTSLLATLRSYQAEEERIYYGDPLSWLFVPVFENFAEGGRKVVGVINALIHWKSYFNNVLLSSVPDLIVVLEYKCYASSGTDGQDEAQRRRMKSTSTTTSKQSPPKKKEFDRNLETTFTIIDVSDFEVTDTDAPGEGDGGGDGDGYWDIPATNTPPPDNANGYWDVPPSTTTPPPADEDNGNGYWDVPPSTTTEPPAGDDNSNGYWDISPTTTPESGSDGGSSSSNNNNNDWEVLSVTTAAPTAASNNDYWQVAPPTTTAPASTASDTNNDYWQVQSPTTTPPGNNDYWQVPPPTTATATPTVEASQSTTGATMEAGTRPAEEDLSALTNEEIAEATSEFYGYESAAGTEEEASLALFTMVIEGDEAHAVGTGDQHDANFDGWMRQGIFATHNLEDGTVGGIEMDSRCNYYIYVYPTQSFYDTYVTTTPIKITVAIVMVFIFAIVLFLVYNRLVEKRQRKVLQKATQSTALVASLFPKNVRDRLLQGGGRDQDGKGELGLGNKSRLKGFMAGETEGDDENAAPIADLFPHCTVFFGDISGFTAWSSTREPSQVFTLLQTVYQGFDTLAKRRRVFKVETIGDCYMAVTGLPDPQEAHASIMIRFAWDCIQKMKEVTKKLESTLGPDTTDLSMRIGLHSGPVTAGVLRGDRARFQLFGDTVNTASRMESTGMRGKIQVSEATANLLRDVGRDHWVIPREDAVKAKGKGVLRTFWANPKNKRSVNGSSWEGSSEDQEEEEGEDPSEEAEEEAATGGITTSVTLHSSQARLVDWIVRLMADDIRKIIAARNRHSIVTATGNFMSGGGPTYHPADGKTCMDEVKEVIHMPKFDAKRAHHAGDSKRVDIDPDVLRELGEYVTGIALLYRKNPFHNFEHACHVTMSVSKLLRRIVSPELSSGTDGFDDKAKRTALQSHLHDYTYGINSDPLAMFAMTFSALIHDVDHRGCSNAQLAKEAPAMATLYHNKSLAEQNSLDLSWDLLMEKRFSTLRQCLFGTKDELLRFRQLIVNIVLATDIFDKELNDLRKNRWRRAFAGEVEQEDVHKSDLRATIVLEHIIQASDVSHTMQHWHVYQKWNRCLFKEMHAAFKDGRLAKDPATFWYKGEMGFFDNYIIPLAGKLKECGVFGVSSDEYLNYAKQNRAEWEERGEEIVAKMQEEVKEDDLGEGSTTVRSALKRLTESPESMLRDAQSIRDSLRSSLTLKNSSKLPPTPEQAQAIRDSLKSSLKKEAAPKLDDVSSTETTSNAGP